jgi:hypothetical protein
VTQLGTATPLLGGAGYGLARPSMSSQDCRSPHPTLRFAAQSSPVAESLVRVGSNTVFPAGQPLPVNKRIWGIGIKQRLLLARQKLSPLVVKKEQVYFHVQRPQLWS